MTTDPPPPRRKWHFTRWLIVLIIATFGWSGWRAYAFRSALKQAKALGWRVGYTDPTNEIRRNWKAAFKKETWLDGMKWLVIPTSGDLRRNLSTAHRLNPMALTIRHAEALRDLSTLSGLTRLQKIDLIHCTRLTNVDALINLSDLQRVLLDNCTDLTNVDGLKNLSALKFVRITGCSGITNVDALKSLSALQEVYLMSCKGLTNVDALKNLPALREVWLNGSTGLTKESIAALKAALPNARIIGP